MILVRKGYPDPFINAGDVGVPRHSHPLPRRYASPQTHHCHRFPCNGQAINLKPTDGRAQQFVNMLCGISLVAATWRMPLGGGPQRTVQHFLKRNEAGGSSFPSMHTSKQLPKEALHAPAVPHIAEALGQHLLRHQQLVRQQPLLHGCPPCLHQVHEGVFIAV